MSVSGGEYEWNMKQDWIRFVNEIRDLVESGMDTTDIRRITGADHDDVVSAVEEIEAGE